MIIALGDIHFRSDYAWFRDAIEKFLIWFKNWELNNANNILFLVGDLTHEEENGGIVLDYIERFFSYNNFKETHITIGNHDYKRIKNLYQLSYEHLNRRPNVFIYKEFILINKENINIALLPYAYPSIKNPKPFEEYSKNIKENKSNIELIFGHVTDSDLFGSAEMVKGLNKVTSNVCLGHIHQRLSKNYIGSVFPLNRKENGERYYRRYEKKDKKVIMIEERLPDFLEFVTINYGEDPIRSDDSVIVHEILNCPAQEIIYSKYQDVYIKKYIKISKKLEYDPSESNTKSSMNKMFSEFIKDSNKSYNRNIIKRCRSVLGITH